MASYMGHEYTPAPKYRVGDRVQTLTDWGECAPKGSFGTVHKLVEARGVTVKIDGGDGFDWYYKLADVKPAPTQVVQGRYRVGDRVRVVKDGFDAGGSYHGAKVGDIDEIVAIGTSDGTPFEGKIWYYKEHEISPAFRPGDRVKLNKHSGVRACGERGTVSAVIGDNVSVRMDDASAYGTVVAFFHADNLDWERAEDCVPVTHAHGCAERKDEQGDVGLWITGSKWSWGTKPKDWPTPQPCIVALIAKDGKPRPSSYPHVHATVAAATTEAERLARNNPGQEFAVYQRVVGRRCEVSYEMKEVA
ncbi:MAG: hypothetical protein WBB98_04905 [Xanthobacteraceae bacterium]